MVFPPGWNVTEPIELAYKLYNVVEALRNAPDSAKAFVSKISNFSGNLKELQDILESDTASPQDLQRLRTTVVESQACVKRCEEFSEGFGKLTQNGRGKMGQAARWAWQEKKVARLREEIDVQMNGIGLTLAIQALADRRTRQGSHSTTESLSPVLRSGTLASLPPYSTPVPNYAQTESHQRPKTPADLLGLGNRDKRKTLDTGTLDLVGAPTGVDGNEIFASPHSSPNKLRPLTGHISSFDLDSEGAMKPLERHRNTTDEVAMSPTGLGISSAISEVSSAGSRVLTSPTVSFQTTSTTEATSSSSKRESILSLESAAVDVLMDNLNGVQVSYYKMKSRISYPVSTIESFRNKQTGRRYIIISPPASSNIKLYLVPPTERIIPHSEHPQAYGSTTKRRVKFIEPYLLRSQRILSERQPSDAMSALSPSLTPMSSATSAASSRSQGSPVLTVNGGVLKEESRRQEYDFESEEDYRRFQELLMGPDVKLQLQVPTKSIMAKKYGESKLTKESQLQYLRLWHFDGRQTLMFFANLSSNRYKEYQIENLRPVESKSNTTIRLDVHLPGTVRRRSSSKSPLIIPTPLAQEHAKFTGDTDGNNMAELDYLSIEFSCANDKNAFLRKAKFHGSGDSPAASPLLSRSVS